MQYLICIKLPGEFSVWKTIIVNSSCGKEDPQVNLSRLAGLDEAILVIGSHYLYLNDYISLLRGLICVSWEQYIGTKSSITTLSLST